MSAESWSLNGRTTRTGSDPSVSDGEEARRLIGCFQGNKTCDGRINKFVRVFSRGNNNFKRSHSSEK